MTAPIAGPDPRSMPQDAADWVARLAAHDCTTAERAAFEDWLAAAPANIDAYLAADAAHGLAQELAGDMRLRKSLAHRHGPAPRRHGAWAMALAACLVVGVGGLWWRGTAPATADQQLATAVGEQREVTLVDGSRVLLDSNTALDVRFTRDVRRMTLQRGRAQFTVGEDPSRPLVVMAGDVEIRDIGTTFQVDRQAQTLDVTLLEGKVAVRPPASAAPFLLDRQGEQLRIAPDGHARRRLLAAAVATGWTRGEMVLERQPLALLVAESNRYTQRPLRLADPALGELQISGVFHPGDQAALLAALGQGWQVRARDDGAQIVLERGKLH